MDTQKLYITRTDKDKLIELRYEIREGTADAGDYQDYENLIISHGLPKSKLDKILKDSKSVDWDDFVKKRKNSKNMSYKRRTKLEAFIVGGLLGLGLYIIFRAIVRN